MRPGPVLLWLRWDMRELSAKNTGVAILAAAVGFLFAPMLTVAQSSGTAQTPTSAPPSTSQSAPAASAPAPTAPSATPADKSTSKNGTHSRCQRAFTASDGYATCSGWYCAPGATH